MAPHGTDPTPNVDKLDEEESNVDKLDADGPGADGSGATRARLLAAVRDAAVERALVDDDGAARHLALAGGLERARRVDTESDGSRRSGPVAPALLAVAAVAAFDAGAGDESGGADDAGPPIGAGGPDGFAGDDSSTSSTEVASPWNPTVARDAHVDAAVEGAALAVRRFDADVRRAAALADVPVAALRRRVEATSERR